MNEKIIDLKKLKDKVLAINMLLKDNGMIERRLIIDEFSRGMDVFEEAKSKHAFKQAIEELGNPFEK